MFKVLIFGKSKPGVGRDAFIHAYENDHMELADRLVLTGKIPPMIKYRRNYIRHDDPLNVGVCEFDVVTEAVFADREAYQANRDGLSEPDVARLLIDDMRKFMDLSDVRYLIVDEFSGGGGADR